MPNVKIKNYLDEEKSYANVNKVWLTRDGGGQETVFAEQTVEFFDMTEDGIPGIWLCYGDFSTAFAVGDTVTVKFDGTEYTCIAFDGAAIGLNENVGIGNTSIGGIGEDTGEPFFAINGVGSSGEIQFAFYTTISGDSHVLAISKATGGGSSLVPFTYGELVENAQISLDFSGGNQKLSVPDGSLVKEATILKPDNLTPENIKQGVDIAGVGGRYVPETEVATVNLDFSSGDMTVRPSAGKTFSGVDILKPATLIPANVAKDVTIAGITGTHEGGGGGAAEPYAEYTTNASGEIIAVKLYGFSHIPGKFFSGLPSIEEVDLSHSPGLKSIGSSAFSSCSGLTSIVIPDSVTSIGSSAFSSCSGLTSVTIGSGVTFIGSSAFSSCKGLTSIVIPDSVTSIGSDTFSSCSGLTSIVIPDSVTSIGGFAFYGCKGLTSVTIGSGVTFIGANAFQNCTALTSAKFKDTTTWYVTQTAGASSGTTLSSSSLANTSTAATWLRSTYYRYYWYKN